MPAAATLERKAFALDSSSYDPSTGVFAGYASVFNGVDAYGDTIVPGAYQKTLPRFLSDGAIFWSHDEKDIVAYATKAVEDDYGLYIEAQFHSTPDAQSLRQKLLERAQAGKRMGLSIGFYPVKAESGDGGGRRLLEIDLKEVSLVLVPADDAARVMGVKAADQDPPPADPEPVDDGPRPEDRATTCGHGTPWDDHAASVVASLEAATDATEALYIRALAADALERKEGRRLSASTRTQLQQALDAKDALLTAFGVLEQLLIDTAPPKTGFRARLAITERRLRVARVFEGDVA